MKKKISGFVRGDYLLVQKSITNRLGIYSHYTTEVFKSFLKFIPNQTFDSANYLNLLDRLFKRIAAVESGDSLHLHDLDFNSAG